MVFDLERLFRLQDGDGYPRGTASEKEPPQEAGGAWAILTLLRCLAQADFGTAAISASLRLSTRSNDIAQDPCS